VVNTALAWKEEHQSIDCFVVDPSSAGLRASMRNVGLDAIPANNAVFTGIQSVAGRLCNDPSGKPRLVVHRQCSNLLREFGSYEWMSNQDGSSKDQPKKEHDHALDALRYSIVHIDGLRSSPSIRSIGGFDEKYKMNPLEDERLWTEI
jgi:phage terminase large subunit